MTGVSMIRQFEGRPAGRRREGLSHGKWHEPPRVLPGRRRHDHRAEPRAGPRARGQRAGPARLHRRRQPRLPAPQGLPRPARRPGRRALRRLRALSERRLRPVDPRFAGLGKRIAQMPPIAGRRRPGQGLPRGARPQGHRRGGDRHARPLARDPDDRRLQGRQGRLRREAAVDDDRRGPGDGRRGAEARPDRPGRHAPPVVAAVRAARRGGPLRGAGQGHRGAGGVLQQHGPRRDRPCAPNRRRRPASTGTSGSARGRPGRSSRRSCRTSSAGGSSTRRRWPTGASTTST